MSAWVALHILVDASCGRAVVGPLTGVSSPFLRLCSTVCSFRESFVAIGTVLSILVFWKPMFMRRSSSCDPVTYPISLNLSMSTTDDYLISRARQPVKSGNDVSRGALQLPLEIQQHIYSYLDTKAFHVARNVCRWWRYASLDAVTLCRQLKKLPIGPMVEITQMKSLDLDLLFSEAAYTLMLGVNLSRLSDPLSTHSRHTTIGYSGSPSTASTADGKWAVTVRNKKVTHYDTTDERHPVVLSERPVNDIRESVDLQSSLRAAHASSQEIAISSNGNLLAIAQEQSIRIYDLSAGSDTGTASELVFKATGHYICGLDFELNNHVLRVRISGRGTVVYLGTPPPDSISTSASIDHWKSEAGLGHVFLNSCFLVPKSSADLPGQDTVVAGLQLLKPYHGGFLFAAQRHSGGESSHYVLGHLECSSTPNGCVSAVDPGSLTVLVRLESFLSAWSYTLNAVSERGLGLYENMPSAHEHHPYFVLSPDGRFLVLAEQDKKTVRHMAYTQIFLYRLPGNALLPLIYPEGQIKDSTVCRMEASAQVQMFRASSRQRVARIPICLTTLPGKITKLRFETAVGADREMFRLVAATTEVARQWGLEDVV